MLKATLDIITLLYPITHVQEDSLYANVLKKIPTVPPQNLTAEDIQQMSLSLEV